MEVAKIEKATCRCMMCYLNCTHEKTDEGDDSGIRLTYTTSMKDRSSALFLVVCVCLRYACICELLEMAKKYRSLVHICNKLFVCIVYRRYVRVNEKLFHCFFLYTLATMFLMYVFVCVKVLEENYSYDVVFVVCLYLYVINKVAGKT